MGDNLEETDQKNETFITKISFPNNESYLDAKRCGQRKLLFQTGKEKGETLAPYRFFLPLPPASVANVIFISFLSSLCS
jgi:hypothetical protein